MIHVYDDNGKKVASGKNLACLIRYAGKYGVDSIALYRDIKAQNSSSKPTLQILFSNSSRSSLVFFESYNVMLDWVLSRKSFKGKPIRFY